MEPSTELGRYRILGEIGRGASGTVYHALDTLIGREVAIKSFRPPAPETPAAGAPEPPGADLLREARSAGMLSHPNIVTVYDVIEGSGGAFSIAMEYVKGRSLAELLAERGRPDFERAVDWISQAAAALDHLHAMGLVHRDVKPANLLLTEDGRVKLTDFGIARSGPAEGGADEDAVLGTPGYMAPEQILGREATPRTDVWSLTVVLYEMLLGERPFAGRTVADVVHGVVHAPVPAPAEGSGLPDGVRALLERGMAKDPRWRFASAGELARELRQILYQAAGEAGAELAGEGMLDRTLVTGPVPAPAGPPARRAETRSGRRLGGRAAAAAAALVAVALAGVVYLAYRALGPDPGVGVATGAAPGTQERSLEVLRLLREGRRLLAAGDTEGAAVFFEVVERLEPGLPQAEGIARLRRAAEAEARRRGAELEAARSALEGRPTRELVASARERVPARGRDAPEALAALDRAERALLAPEGEGGGGATAASGAGRVTVEFSSESPEGVLTIYAGGEQLLRRGFSFYERGWLFTRTPATGGFTEELAVPPGADALWVYVARPEGPARRLEVPGRFPEGSRRTLRVHLPAEGEATAEWGEE